MDKIQCYKTRREQCFEFDRRGEIREVMDNTKPLVTVEVFDHVFLSTTSPYGAC